MQLSQQQSHKGRAWRDKMAGRIITVGGLTVLVTLAVLIWHLLYVTSPLLLTPSLKSVNSWSVPQNEQLLLLEDVSAGRTVLSMAEDCQLNLYQAKAPRSSDMELLKTLPQSCQVSTRALHHGGERYLFQLGGDGLIRMERLIRVAQRIERMQELSFLVKPALPEVIQHWQVALSQRWLTVAIQSDQQWHIHWVSRDRPLDNFTQELDGSGRLLLLPSVKSALWYEDNQAVFTSPDSSQRIVTQQPIETVTAFPDHKAVLIGLEGGEVQKWSSFNQQGQFVYQQIYTLPEQVSIRQMQMFSGKDLGVILSHEQELLLFLGSTGEILQRHTLDKPARGFFLSGNKLFVHHNSSIEQWHIDHASSIVSFESLWEKVWYHGYEEPDYIWQSTTSADTAQAKYSLVPLVVGSLKAALFALMVAIPLALGAAIYTAYFVPDSLRSWLKPGIEMLEAVPSVVIGFIAAIWLVPVVEHHMLAIVLFLWGLPVGLIISAFLQKPVSRWFSLKWQSGWELIMAVPLVLLIAWLAFESGGSLQQWLWPQGWFTDSHTYSSKNALVVALALGLAIVPSIYSLAEDAIYEVPSHLRQASFALGATRAQTLRYVVLVAAYPGIFSSVMLGLSRAFGETMIVLMVTGNTPVADWDPFSGLRALTANIAIELPEAEVNSIHYRILFFTALLLFAFTFVINTLAELIRGRLRRHYQNV
ncbi:ABC transporter permease subunit [Lacimicrobium alkaliphilum]|uniref:Phosphate ABC transporter permease n=1 Tax=Lacimicrobium alkaliphilum TaxID=1526571 RepID=A0ABQ1RFG4_9ALTE|nr:ABC transporter permease subunit [Lacimicrobium alkaliphilum]GGD66000.1 phosphate ABC transporter permease [Lacimicrobium alkaliphilum]